jgi:hypothetical protein
MSYLLDDVGAVSQVLVLVSEVQLRSDQGHVQLVVNPSQNKNDSNLYIDRMEPRRGGSS